MKKYVYIILLAIICSSCSSFERMHYRHMRKVPAKQVEFLTAVPEKSCYVEVMREEIIVVEQTDSTRSVSMEMIAESSVFADPVIPIHIDADTLIKKPGNIRTVSHTHQSLRHDWSLLIAILMIIGGIFLLLYVGFVVPYFNILLLLRIALGLFIVYSGVRLLLTGVMIIRNRFRTPKTYKES